VEYLASFARLKGKKMRKKEKERRWLDASWRTIFDTSNVFSHINFLKLCRIVPSMQEKNESSLAVFNAAGVAWAIRRKARRASADRIRID
jgi:hypothetical protein